MALGIGQGPEGRRQFDPEGLEQGGPGALDADRAQGPARVAAVHHFKADRHAELIHAGGVAMEAGTVQGQFHPVIEDGPVGIAGVGRIRLDQTAGGLIHPQPQGRAQAQVDPAAVQAQAAGNLQGRPVAEVEGVVAPIPAVLGDPVVGRGTGPELAVPGQAAEAAIAVPAGEGDKGRRGGQGAGGGVDEAKRDPLPGRVGIEGFPGRGPRRRTGGGPGGRPGQGAEPEQGQGQGQGQAEQPARVGKRIVC